MLLVTSINTNASLRPLLRISIPIFCAMMINSLWLTVDVFFLYRTHPEFAAAATYLLPWLLLAYAFLDGCGVPLTVLMGQAVGADDADLMVRVRAMGFVVACGIGVLLSVTTYAAFFNHFQTGLPPKSPLA